jgi:predicted transcriptional regulator of viral defense system
MLYEPSYLSLEWALRYYNLIPEGVYQYTSCTPKKTQMYALSAGNFSYHSLHSRWNWGYDLHTIGRYVTIRIASPEKTICDYLHFHNEIRNTDDFEEQRINRLVWQEIASDELLQHYASRYSKSVQKRVQLFLAYIHTNDV